MTTLLPWLAFGLTLLALYLLLNWLPSLVTARALSDLIIGQGLIWVLAAIYSDRLPDRHNRKSNPHAFRQ